MIKNSTSSKINSKIFIRCFLQTQKVYVFNSLIWVIHSNKDNSTEKQNKIYLFELYTFFGAYFYHQCIYQLLDTRIFMVDSSDKL